MIGKKTCEYSGKSVSVYEKIREEKLEKVVEKRIINNYTFYRDRSKIERYTKYKKNRNKWEQKAKEKEYLYYICDYCKDEIKILNKKYEMTGGIVVLPRTLTKRENITLVLCNKCLKPVLDEFENTKIK